jgi:hypothetical protein
VGGFQCERASYRSSNPMIGSAIGAPERNRDRPGHDPTLTMASLWACWPSATSAGVVNG